MIVSKFYVPVSEQSRQCRNARVPTSCSDKVATGNGFWLGCAITLSYVSLILRFHCGFAVGLSGRRQPSTKMNVSRGARLHSWCMFRYSRVGNISLPAHREQWFGEWWFAPACENWSAIWFGNLYFIPLIRLSRREQQPLNSLPFFKSHCLRACLHVLWICKRLKWLCLNLGYHSYFRST